MKRALLLLLVLFSFGCIQMPWDQKNRLEIVSNEAPYSATMIAYIDAPKLLNHPAVSEKLNLSGPATFLPNLLTSVHVIGFAEDYVLVVEPSVSISSFLPTIIETIASISGNKASSLQEQNYSGIKIDTMGNTSFFENNNLFYIGKLDRLKQIIDVKNGATNARTKFMMINLKVPQNDMMVAVVGGTIANLTISEAGINADLAPSSTNKLSAIAYLTQLIVSPVVTEQVIRTQLTPAKGVIIDSLIVVNTSKQVQLNATIDLQLILKDMDQKANASTMTNGAG